MKNLSDKLTKLSAKSTKSPKKLSSTNLNQRQNHSTSGHPMIMKLRNCSEAIRVPECLNVHSSLILQAYEIYI